jgi:hypothetical protein
MLENIQKTQETDASNKTLNSSRNPWHVYAVGCYITNEDNRLISNKPGGTIYGKHWRDEITFADPNYHEN